ncbi:ABC transporter [Mesobacillus boroniphilus JCM 21738]|uniref:ABC transporter n=1 Tax=Mesobacillus boroniphilus JCM 21738 TaxID=1294265 RepID=W4RP08_9BACI|nr:ABC transporter [Mesobacillus boroniphilus JCM 21738]
MLSVLSKLSWFFKENWKRYSVAISLLIFVGILDVLPPKIVGMAIDAIQIGSMNQNLILKYIGGLLLITVVSYFITYIWMYQLFGGAS